MTSHGMMLFLCAALMLSGCVTRDVRKSEPVTPEENPFADAMTQGRDYESRGDLAEALESYSQALSLKPGDASALAAASRVEAAQAVRVREKTETSRVLKKKYPEFRVHAIRSGETLSDIAMQYYGTYKTQIFYKPEQKKLMVSDLIARYNDTDARRLKTGQELKLPALENLPFIDGVGIVPEEKEDGAEPAPGPGDASPDDEAAGSSSTKTSAPEQPAKPAEKPAGDDIDAETARNRRLEKGIAFFNQRKYQQAIDELSPADAEPMARQYLSKSFLEQGKDMLKRGDYLKAGQGFMSALEYDPGCDECRKLLEKSEQTYLDIHYKKGIEHFQNEELKAAIYEWKLVQAVDPGYKQVTENIETAENLLEKLEKI